MSNLQECSIDELNEIIRVCVVTCPWSNETKFPSMKKITVIKSCGFANSDGDALEKKEQVGVETEEELWKLKLSEMKENGLRLVTGILNFCTITSCTVLFSRDMLIHEG